MSDGTDGQDLVNALDTASSAAASGVPMPQAGAIASPFPVIQPVVQQLGDQPDLSVPPYLAEPAPAPLGYPAPNNLPPPAAYSSMPDVTSNVHAPEDTGPLASIKHDALIELRPLVDKLNLGAEEKFDTYLLLIRSTDDTDLIAPAHEAAKAIVDETRRAEALLDIIKEIDYLSHPKSA